MIRNVHERVVAAPVERVGELLDRLGGPDDVLWPAPEWVALRLDGPLAVGARGGQGGADHFVVEAHEPGRRVDLAINPRIGLRGVVAFTAEPHGPDATLLRHDTRARTVGVMRWVWPLYLRRMHDACVEDLLDRAQDAVGAPPARRSRHPLSVRLLRPLVEREPVRDVPVPATALLAGALPEVDWSDAHAIARPPGSTADPRAWVDASFHSRSRAGAALMGVRDALAVLVGIAPSRRPTGDGSGTGSFAIVAAAPDEVLLGSDERHLDFRASVLVEAERVVLSTVVRRHGLRGRAYFAVVAPLHPTVVRAMLRRAARRVAASGRDPGRRTAGTVGALR